jgi:sec-independent protein translocase protein TatA
MIRAPPRRRRLVVMGLDNPIHIVFIVVILLLVFGAKRLPEIGRSLGSGMREFKDSVSGNQASSAQQQQTLTPTAQQPQQAPVAQPAPVQAPVPPAAAPPTPTQAAAPAPAPAEPPQPQPQPQHQA